MDLAVKFMNGTDMNARIGTVGAGRIVGNDIRSNDQEFSWSDANHRQIAGVRVDL
ncbi:hypothetical protein [Pseudosulfitobacter sp. SM2401]|uniref:hypothetical protein n=1 Tax=Pseudosulfitobacter sp. SM2401 TaxID=3350098 RepID=UPI0036F227E5